MCVFLALHESASEIVLQNLCVSFSLAPLAASLRVHAAGNMGVDKDMIKAVEKGDLAEVQRLVGRGANVNAKDSAVSWRRDR